MIARLIGLLKEKKLTLAAAESCTGGAFMARCVLVSGASEVLRGGVVAYSEDLKVKLLGVKQETLDEHGVVSEQVAKEMAVGLRGKLGADIGVAITGFAGPTGDPVGEVCFAVAIGGDVFPVTKNFSGTRSEIIDASVDFIGEWLCEALS